MPYKDPTVSDVAKITNILFSVIEQVEVLKVEGDVPKNSLNKTYISIDAVVERIKR